MKDAVIICFMFCIFAAGCTNSYDKKVEGLGVLSKEYLAINQPDELKDQLLKIVQFFKEEESNISEQYLKSSWLMLTYLRLSIIEEERGNSAKANIYFQKARYWYICKLESQNENKTFSEIAKKISQFTPQNGKELILSIESDFLDKVNERNQSQTSKNNTNGL